MLANNGMHLEKTMSGGSYNYLYNASVEELALYREEDLRCMTERLAELGYDDVAKDTEELSRLVSSTYSCLAEAKQRASDVWKAVEWFDSCDCKIQEVEKAITDYRQKSKANPKAKHDIRD